MAPTAQLDWTPTMQSILGSDPGAALYAEASIWFDKLERFRAEENEKMFLREPAPQDIEIHKTLLLRLIADGEHLLTLIRQAGGLISNRERIKVEDIDAAVKGLHDTLRGWHGSIPSDQRKKHLSEIFPDVA